MTAASNSEGRKRAAEASGQITHWGPDGGEPFTLPTRKRHTSAPDPVEVVARELFRQQLDQRVAIPTFSTPQAERVIAALRAEGMINE